MTTESANDIRANVLDRMERQDRFLKLSIAAAALVEAALLGTALWLTNFNDRTQVLILVTSILGYTIVGLGLMALGAHVSRSLSALIAALDGRSTR
jgi:hypothetical protein